jgi:hypothetical protein
VIVPDVAALFVTVPVPKTEFTPALPAVEPPAPMVTVYDVEDATT